MRRRNRRATGDVKPDQTQRLINQPTAEDKSTKSSPSPFPHIYVGHNTIETKFNPQENPETQIEENKDTADRSNRVMRPRIAIWQHFCDSFDRHHASVAAVAALVTTLATIVIAIVTGVYAFYSKRQWIALQDANRINNSALVSVQRAYVTFKGFESGGTRPESPEIGETAGIGKEGGFRFTASWENSGTTPAIKVINYFSVDEVPLNETFAFRTKLSNFRNIVIGPKAQLSSGTIVKPTAFWESVKDRHIYFWGWVVYRDVFSDTKLHVTEFCQDLTGVGRLVQHGAKLTNTAPVTFLWDVCDIHNCSDEDCEDYNALESLWEKNNQHVTLRPR